MFFIGLCNFNVVLSTSLPFFLTGFFSVPKSGPSLPPLQQKPLLFSHFVLIHPCLNAGYCTQTSTVPEKNFPKSDLFCPFRLERFALWHIPGWAIGTFEVLHWTARHGASVAVRAKSRSHGTDARARLPSPWLPCDLGRKCAALRSPFASNPHSSVQSDLERTVSEVFFFALPF